MMGRRIIGAGAQGKPRETIRASGRRGRRFVRLFSLLLVSVIGLGVAQPGGDAMPEDEGDRDERIVFRHFV